MRVCSAAGGFSWLAPRGATTNKKTALAATARKTANRIRRNGSANRLSKRSPGTSHHEIRCIVAASRWLKPSLPFVPSLRDQSQLSTAAATQHHCFLRDVPPLSGPRLFLVMLRHEAGKERSRTSSNGISRATLTENCGIASEFKFWVLIFCASRSLSS